MKFELYVGVYPNHNLIGSFEKICDAMKSGGRRYPGERMFINYDNSTVRMYEPFSKRWVYVNHK